MTGNLQDKTVKRGFWGAALFYFFIAFEFMYMASPFAVYFYSVYRPVLNYFNRVPALSWLVSYFMPHCVSETSSALINLHNILGGLFAVVGFTTFCIGAIQIYYHKLARRGAVTGGVYNIIRHPQYASFILCSFGLLLLWPRYIVLVMFITMVFAYYLLARVEERECEAKFGQEYIDYKKRTNMFLPIKLPFRIKFPMPQSKSARFCAGMAVYFITLAAALGLALLINAQAIDSLYAVYTKDSAYISTVREDQATLEKVVGIATADPMVQARLAQEGPTSNLKYLNYIVPTSWSVPEIPMNPVAGGIGHHSPSNYDRSRYKVIFTRATLRTTEEIQGMSFLINVAKREPIVEVWVGLNEGKVEKILEMPERIKYEGIPVAVY